MVYLQVLNLSNFTHIPVLGNHDYKRNADLIRNTLQENGIKVLTNEKAVPIQGIEVYGVGDFRSAEFHPEKILPKEETTQAPFRVVMSHNPDSAKVLSNYPIDLVVSGHSHGGFKK